MTKKSFQLDGDIPTCCECFVLSSQLFFFVICFYNFDFLSVNGELLFGKK